jgi:ABC-type uncharacterized transport system substrate-binding protein
VRRRELIVSLGLTATWPLTVRAQKPVKNLTVGVLHPGQLATMNLRMAAFREGLNKSDNHSDPAIQIVVRSADGDLSRLPALAMELVDSRVDAILAVGPPAVRAAHGATATVPTVALDLESDPVASALIASIGRPGGNITGVFLDVPDFSAKCLQLNDDSTAR